MPIPLIVAAAATLAVGSGIFGAKKAYDAYEMNDDAKSYQHDAERLNEKTQEKFEKAGKDLGKSAEKLQNLALDITTKDFVRFENILDRIEQSSPNAFSNIKTVSLKEVNITRNEISQFDGITTGFFTGAASGAALGATIYSGVGALAAASTGTAISTLSGAAATNATLAWLGGGALSAGGLGIAGGTAVLGGLIAGPAIAVTGLFMASKAKENLENAKYIYNKVKAYCEACDQKTLEMNHYKNSITERFDALSKERQSFLEHLDILEEQLDITDNYNEWLDYSKKALEMAMNEVTSLCALLNEKPKDEDEITKKLSELDVLIKELADKLN